MRIVDIFYLGFIPVLNHLDIEAEVYDISPEASATFWRRVDGNYADLLHKSLEPENA